MNTKEIWLKTQDIFERALDRPPADREIFVRSICDDSALADKVIHMLNFADTSSDLIHAAIEGAVAEMDKLEAMIGQRVGSYRLVQLLGEGGMGAVYLAERDDLEFRHRVAIKVIRRNLNHPGLHTLFQNERQILADLNHPYICRLMDGGRTVDGQIYIVMEYVSGMPIDQHCEVKKLSVRARLKLFLKVCACVQALHQKLVIHCDLKPTNILVNESGDPKLLDFGIAQASGRHPSEEQGSEALAGGYTLEYSSPEQIQGGRQDVTSDVYSLGMILGKMLKDATPFSQLLGICRQATQPDPIHRYPTVEALMADVRRFLVNRPVLSVPSSLSYRGLCWFRRNRLLASSLLIFCTLTSIWLYREHSLKDKVDNAAQSKREATDFLANIFRNIDPYSYQGKPLTGIEILDSAMAQIDKSMKLGPESLLQLRLRLATSYRALGAPEKAEAILLSALQTAQSDSSASTESIAMLYGSLAENARQAFQNEKAKAWFEQAEMLWSNQGETPSHMEFLHNYSIFQRDRFDIDRAAELNQMVLAYCARQQGTMQETCLTAEHYRATILARQQRFEEAILQFESALQKQKRYFGERSLYVLGTLSSYIEVLRQHNRFEGLEEKMLQSVRLVKDIHPPGHPYRNQVMNVLANFYHDQARYPEAVALYQQMMDETEGSAHKEGFLVPGIVNNLALVYSDMERYDDALELFQKASRLQTKLLPMDDPVVSYGYQQLGYISILRQDFEAAHDFLNKALTLRQKSKDELSLALTLEQLALVSIRTGRIEPAKDFMQKAWLHAKGRFVENDMREARFFATDALISHATGHKEDSIQKINRSLAIVQGARSNQHPMFARYLIRRSEFSANRDDVKLAVGILERTLPAKAPSLLKARDMLHR